MTLLQQPEHFGQLVLGTGGKFLVGFLPLLPNNRNILLQILLVEVMRCQETILFRRGFKLLVHHVDRIPNLIHAHRHVLAVLRTNQVAVGRRKSRSQSIRTNHTDGGESNPDRMGSIMGIGKQEEFLHRIPLANLHLLAVERSQGPNHLALFQTARRMEFSGPRVDERSKPIKQLPILIGSIARADNPQLAIIRLAINAIRPNRLPRHPQFLSFRGVRNLERKQTNLPCQSSRLNRLLHRQSLVLGNFLSKSMPGLLASKKHTFDFSSHFLLLEPR